MKNKWRATILALAFGIFGLHRFYLQQGGRGVTMFIFALVGLMGMISSGEGDGYQIWVVLGAIALLDGILLLAMSEEDFDERYNRRMLRKKALEERTLRKKVNQYKEQGIKYYKDYAFEDAIISFDDALKHDPKDAEIPFFKACCYSYMEHTQKALEQLDLAIKMGFSDIKRIHTHEALAYIRTEEIFEEFERNGFRLRKKQVFKSTLPSAPITDNIIEQIKKLGELHEKGYLTEQEFLKEKQRILGK